jgi:hypothetical protein
MPVLVVLFGLCLPLTALLTWQDQSSQQPGEGTEATPLEDFRERYPYQKAGLWMAVEVEDSVVTGTRRRIYFDKRAVTRAVVGHKGGKGRNGSPLPYNDGTVFVAERLDAEGHVEDTEVMILRTEGDPEFLLFDAEGQRSTRFSQPGDEGPATDNVPAVCIDCHTGSNYFHPTMSFPKEPKGNRLLVKDHYRDLDIVEYFLEGFHRAQHTFGPYGSLWMSKLKWDAIEGQLSKSDMAAYRILISRYPQLMSKPAQEQPPKRQDPPPGR